MKKKFIRTFVVFGSLFVLQLLDPTSATYGMLPSIDEELSELRKKGASINSIGTCKHNANHTKQSCTDCTQTIGRIKQLQSQKDALFKQQQTESDLRAELLRAQIAALKGGSGK